MTQIAYRTEKPCTYSEAAHRGVRAYGVIMSDIRAGYALAGRFYFMLNQRQYFSVDENDVQDLKYGPDPVQRHSRAARKRN